MKSLEIAGAALLLALGFTLPAAAAAGIAVIDRYAEDTFQRSGLPGVAVAMVEGDRLVYSRGFGDDGNGGAVTPDTPFILGSTSKGFTALAILQLAEAGRLKLDDPAAHYLPGLFRDAPAARRITIRMLLNQVSGISHEAGDQPVWDAGETGPAALRRWALGLNATALNRAPGASYEYSNANYVVLGAIVEAVSGVAYADYMQAHVFAALGMSHTRAVEAGPLARGHKQFFGLNYVSDLPYPTSFVPVGFIVSTANDVAKYLAAQLPGSADARKLGISDADIALWHAGTAPMDPDGKAHYAMGWVTDTFNGLPVVFHNGDTGVFSSEFVLDIKNRRAVVVLSNGSGWLSSEYLHQIASGIVNQAAGHAPRDDTGIHRMILGIYLAVLAVPLAQLLALWLMRRRKKGWLGQTWPVVVHAALAAALIVALPRQIFGIPFAELFTSFPDMAWAAILSAVFAVVALVQAVRGVRTQPS